MRTRSNSPSTLPSSSSGMNVLTLAELSMDGVEWSKDLLHSTPVESWLE
jgi:hypothetical protein